MMHAMKAMMPSFPSLRRIWTRALRVWIMAMIKDPKQILPIEVVQARLKLAIVGDLLMPWGDPAMK